jgi:serine phosphatase RsbU (regulator of sigma subunit)
LPEAQNVDGDEFGFERLAALASQLSAPAISDKAAGAPLLTTLRQALAEFSGGRPLDDDLTLALVQRL